MLILSRKPAQRFRILTRDGEIWVTVVQVKDGKVRLGVDAPQSMEVMREELLPLSERYETNEQGDESCKATE